MQIKFSIVFKNILCSCKFWPCWKCSQDCSYIDWKILAPLYSERQDCLSEKVIHFLGGNGEVLGCLVPTSPQQHTGDTPHLQQCLWVYGTLEMTQEPSYLNLKKSIILFVILFPEVPDRREFLRGKQYFNPLFQL